MVKLLAMIFFSLINKLPMPSRIKWINKLMKKLKGYLAKILFEYVGENVNIRPGVKLRGTSNISLGSNSSIGDNSKIVARDKVFIGENILMAPDVLILTENHNIPKDELILNSGTTSKPVFIGNDVWIGSRVIILPGAILNDGIVVAAGAVVLGREYPPYSIIGGVPAKVISHRR